ncbi:hypothetical protein NS229_12310 [Methylobacterium indicum]|nr:hypothetical protein NS229_12310 [Methylobacterium indicum]
MVRRRLSPRPMSAAAESRRRRSPSRALHRHRSRRGPPDRAIEKIANCFVLMAASIDFAQYC